MNLALHIASYWLLLSAVIAMGFGLFAEQGSGE